MMQTGDGYNDKNEAADLARSIKEAKAEASIPTNRIAANDQDEAANVQLALEESEEASRQLLPQELQIREQNRFLEDSHQPSLRINILDKETAVKDNE